MKKIYLNPYLTYARIRDKNDILKTILFYACDSIPPDIVVFHLRITYNGKYYRDNYAWCFTDKIVYLKNWDLYGYYPLSDAEFRHTFMQDPNIEPWSELHYKDYRSGRNRGMPIVNYNSIPNNDRER